MPSITNPPKLRASKQGVKDAVGYSGTIFTAVMLGVAGLGAFALVRPFIAQVPVVGSVFRSGAGGQAPSWFGGQ